MNPRTQQIIQLEVVAWLFTAVLTGIVLFPILNALTTYDFLWHNVFFIALFVTYTRYLFLWKYSFFANSLIIKVLILLLAIPMVFQMIACLNTFQVYLDDSGQNAFMQHLKTPLSYAAQENLVNYIRNQFVFFATSSIIVGVLLPIRSIVSMWRARNKGTT